MVLINKEIKRAVYSFLSGGSRSGCSELHDDQLKSSESSEEMQKRNVHRNYFFFIPVALIMEVKLTNS